MLAIARLYKQGVSPTVIARRFRVSTWAVHDLRKRLKLPPQRKRRVYRKADPADIDRAREALGG